MAPRTSDSMARMFRSRVEHTTVGSNVVDVVGDARRVGVRRHADLLERVVGDEHVIPPALQGLWVMSGRRGGLTSTISTQPAGAEQHATRLRDAVRADR